MIGHVPHHKLSSEEVVDRRICDVVATCNFVRSRADVRRLIKNKGLSVNARRIEDELDLIYQADLIDNKYIIFSLGKKKRAILEIC
jgi:tyrosyl-tRNA synthetase